MMEDELKLNKEFLSEVKKLINGMNESKIHNMVDHTTPFEYKMDVEEFREKI